MRLAKTILLSLCSLTSASLYGQQSIIDSLKAKQAINNDTLLLVQSSLLSEAWVDMNVDSAIWYGNRYLALAQKLNYKINEADALQRIAWNMVQINSTKSLELLFASQQILAETTRGNLLPGSYLNMLGIIKSIQNFREYRKYISGKMYSSFSWVYYLNGDHNQSNLYNARLKEIVESLPATDLTAWAYLVLGVSTINPDSTLSYLHKSYHSAYETGTLKYLWLIDDYVAKAYREKKDSLQELHYKRASLHHSVKYSAGSSIAWAFIGLADFYNIHHVDDSALVYCYKALENVQSSQYLGKDEMEYWTTKFLSELYKKYNKRDSVLKYIEWMHSSYEKINDNQKSALFKEADYKLQSQQAAIDSAKEKLRNKIRLYALLAGLGVFILLSWIFWRNSKRRRKEFVKLERQKAKTDQALQELKSTQVQLIQSEKMASLGELTAGIAHEIQNPLNFVNNFSDLNKELLAEMNEEIEKGNFDEIKGIANDIADNEKKINHHGKRADAIVKGMLQHSRASSGKKEPTDINKLADEYLRLAYHGLRAKDNSFNATLKTDYDETIGNINIIPQDIGRVLLNLYNNAFYAVNEKKKLQTDNYEPTVLVSTKRLNGKIEISVQDNGNGIPQKIVDKIFQPFFTTKPTGHGTGLGLSLAYDIVKAHGGELKVETKEGEGAEFIISLPHWLNHGLK